MVEGKATATGSIGIITGDCSYEAALADALKQSGARGLKNIVVDYKVKNILMLMAEYTTIVRGEPIKVSMPSLRLCILIRLHSVLDRLGYWVVIVTYPLIFELIGCKKSIAVFMHASQR